MAKRKLPPIAVFGFLMPNFLGFFFFTLFPIILSLWMAFTNWNLKPAVEYEFLGLRNFHDMLGVRPLGQEDVGLWALYMASAAAVVLGLIGLLWSNVAGWRGTKTAGVLVVGLGVATCLGAIVSGASHGLVIVGALGGLCGLAATRREDGTWRLGFGTMPAVLLAAGAAGLWLLHGGMWQTYEPRDARFWAYLYNTVYLMLAIPIAIAGSLALALLVNEELPLGRIRARLTGAGVCLACGVLTLLVLWGMGHPNVALLGAVFWLMVGLGLAFNVVSFRTTFYLPTFCAGVALMILWKALYNPETGPINAGLGGLMTSFGWQADAAQPGHFLGPYGWHVALPQWLGSVDWSKPSIMLMGIWTGIGGTNFLLYLAGLSNMPQDLIDAAEVDGAGFWGKFRHILWPQLAPTTFFISIMAIIGGLQGGFEEARVMTNGGPAGSTTTLTFYVYNKLFQDLDLGYAAAISWVLFTIIFVMTALNWKFGKDLEVSP